MLSNSSNNNNGGDDKKNLQNDISFFTSNNLNSIQFSFICIASFYNKIVSRCFTESETQSQNPQVSTVAGKNSLLTGRNT